MPKTICDVCSKEIEATDAVTCDECMITMCFECSESHECSDDDATIPISDDTEVESENEESGDQESGSDGELGSREAEHYHQIRLLAADVMVARGNYESIKAQLALAKKMYAMKADELQQLIYDGPDAQLKIEFDDDQEEKASEEDDSSKSEDEDYDEWLKAGIRESLDLTPAQFEKLEENGINTIGELEAFRSKPGLKSIKGIGKSAITRIEDEILKFYTSQQV